VVFSKGFESFKARLRKSREALSGGLSRILSSGADRAEILEQVEELLVAADVGVRTATEIVEKVRSAGVSASPDAVRAAIKDEVVAILRSAEAKAEPGVGMGAGTGAGGAAPRVVMVVGVNGTGKTTTIAKLAHRYREEGKTVLLAAADTYRAAAIEQLEVWAERVGAQVVKHKPGADAASVAFDACAAAKARGSDLVVIDTAGRLQTKKNLMDEVAKIARVVGKVVEGAPHEVLLVLDATTGQNAVSQARVFSEVCGVTGIVVAKVDGTAKGGIVVAIAKELGIPILFVGTGESLEDIETFDAAAFAEALLG
jgi:fused signal recognition particle receptor